MRKTLLLIVGSMVLGCSPAGQVGVAGTLGIVRSIPYPRGAVFINDLAYDGDYLWTTGINTTVGGGGQASLITYRVSTYNGGVSRWFPAQDYPSGFGHAWDGENLWITSPAVALRPPDIYPDYVHKIDGGGNVLESFAAPLSPDARPVGAAWDGTALWISDSTSRTIWRVDPADGTVLTSFDAPGDWVAGLTWDGTSLWSASGRDSVPVLYEMDPSGNVLEEWSIPDGIGGPGLTFDGSRLWISDEGSRRFYALLPVPEPSSLMLLLIAGTCLLAIRRWRRPHDRHL